ncbi:MAG: hypothetical protein R2722_02255 [Tessaracoccus sp.]
MKTSMLPHRLHWPLIFGLATLALVRPLFSIVGWSDALGKPATPVLLTVGITLAWVLIVGYSRVGSPVATLVATGLVYAVMAIVLSAVLSPILSGELQGPSTTPVGIVAVLLTNALWGLAAGGIAVLVRRARGEDVRRSDLGDLSQ